MEWNLYSVPGIFCVRADRIIGTAIQVILESDPEMDIGIAECLDYEEDDNLDPVTNPKRLFSIALELQVEELPRLVPVFNEIYRAHYDQMVRFVGIHDDDLSPQDKEDRIAQLRAYKFVADLLSDHVEKLGLLSPIE